MLSESSGFSSLAMHEQQALGTYHTYFNAFDSVVSILTHTDEPDYLLDMLQVLGQASRSSMTGLYLNDEHGRCAKLVAAWRDQDCSLLEYTPAPFLSIDYDQYALLADTLAVGMVLNKSLLELPLAEQMLLAQVGIRHLLCVPLLQGGELFGFLAFLNDSEERQPDSVALRLLAMLSNHVAQALGKAKLEAESLANQQRLRALVGATQDMVFELDAQAIVRHVWSGHPALPAGDVMLNRPMATVLPYELASELLRLLPQILAGQSSQQFNCMLPEQDVCLLVRVQPVGTAQQRSVVVLLQDISALMHDAARKKTMLDTLNLLEEAIVDLLPTGVLTEATLGWSKLRGIEARDLPAELGRPLISWVHPEDIKLVSHIIDRQAKSKEPASERFRLLRADGDFIWVELRLIAHFSPDGRVTALRGVMRDVTVAHLNEQNITQMALYDGLTRLPNRLLLDNELHRAIDEARREHRKVALGFIDLDHFKQINDAFGHKTGDDLLVMLAQRLNEVLPENGLLARWGGDEFIALIPEVESQKHLAEIAEQLRLAARQSIMINGMETQPTVSVGFAIYPDNAESGDELLSAADHTMYHAKHAGRNSVCFYSDIVHLKALGREHVAIQSRLSSAIRHGGLQVFYQPIVNARTGEVIAVEALARWMDDKSGWISPELFIPMAEKVGLIQELSEQIMLQSFAKLRDWRESGLSQKLMINVSRSQLYLPTFVTTLVERLTQFKLRPSDVIIEITESVALTDYARQMRHLRQLGAAGFVLAIDDFGTGYSSLSQLHEMPAQMLKVDVSFSQRLHTEDGRRVMQAIAQMAQALQLDLVIEGVETLETVRFLQGLGVNYMQGFYFSQPVPSGVAELWMRLGLQGKT
ncbi:EAL domain-containing protein [Chitinibacter bivalviorum]|uniref:EAL domain-containing protein n=1 Tax=Chitinibacter bivalviorum TaxID=2739434 RepID=A0A7H9BJP6_9NEIS|nr:EAL domain-containing protein [Chitinibacter bivalviorum]QLG88592.1 EAL domain-containing protein [Chitinibacter bivalviorum]